MRNPQGCVGHSKVIGIILNNSILRVVAIILAVFFGFLVISVPTVKAYNATQLVQNSGFEADPVGTGWTINTGNPDIGAWSGTSWHGGTRGLKLGALSMAVVDAYTLQEYAYTPVNIAIPSNAGNVAFSAWFNIDSSEFLPGLDKLGIVVLNAADPTEHLCDIWNDATVVTKNVWVNVTCDLTSTKGKTVGILIKLITDKVDPTIANIDDVSIIADFPDSTAPTTSAAISPAAPNGTSGIYTVVPIITLNAADDAGGSGVAATYYNWDSAANTQYTGAITTPEGVHTLYYQTVDGAGNTEAAKTIVIKVDTSAPGITLSSPTADSTVTNKLVTVSGVANDSSGIQSVLVNGAAVTVQPGNIFSTTLTLALGQNTITITAIDGAGNPTSQALMVTLKQPTPRVLGVSTSRPTIESGKLVGSKFKYTLNGKQISITPFAASYKGAIWAKKIDFGSELGVVYLFAPLDTLLQARLKAYNTKGKLLVAAQPFGSLSTGNYKLKIIIQPSTDVVFLVVMSKTDAKTVRVYEVTSKGLTKRGTLLISQKSNAGEVVAQFLKIYDGDYGLVTAMPGKKKTIRVWEYDVALGNFIQDKTFDTNTIKLSGTSFSVK